MFNKGLNYVITLTNQAKGPLNSLIKQIDSLSNRGKDAMSQIGFGVAGIAATGATMANALAPALEMTRALGEVSALDVAADGLELLQRKALNFSNQYGLSAAEFVSSSYDIQSAISGLTASELASFTESANLIGKATKSSAAAMTNYMGTMYGIFEKDALKLGKANWVEKIAGQTTYTANMFKSSGESMSQAFTALGAKAQSAGIDVAEQMAVLGSLQATMPGAMAGTKYSAFLKGVAKAQENLGISMSDSNGRMLDAVSILRKLKSRYGDTIELAESKELAKAFGSDDAVAVIELLLPKIDSLKGSINEIAQIDGLDQVKQMADKTTDPFMRLSQIITNIKVAIGTQVLKAVTPFFNKLADVGASIVDFLSVNKNIARLVGYIVGGLIGLTAVVPIIMTVVGLIKLWGVATSALMLPLGGLKKGFSSFFKILRIGFLTSPFGIALIAMTALFLFVRKFKNELKVFFAGVMQGFQQWGVSFEPIKTALSNLGAAFGRIWNAITSLFTPMQQNSEMMDKWAVAGEVVGLILGVIADVAIIAVSTIINGFGVVLDFVTSVITSVTQGWDDFFNAVSSGNILAAIGQIWTGIQNVITGVWDNIKKTAIEFVNSLIALVNKFGADIKPIEIPVTANTQGLNLQHLQGLSLTAQPVQTSMTQMASAVQSGAPLRAATPLRYESQNSRTFSQIANNSRSTVNYSPTIHITQRPNESGSQLAQRITAYEKAQLGS